MAVGRVAVTNCRFKRNRMGTAVRMHAILYADAGRFSHRSTMQGGAIYFNCVLGARLLEISGSSFVANGGAVQADEGGGGVDASSGPQPVICVGDGCNNGNFTCAEYLNYVVTAKKDTIQWECLGHTLEWHVRFGDLNFYHLPEGVTTDLADGFKIVDLCPAECSEVVSRVIIRHQCSQYNLAV